VTTHDNIHIPTESLPHWIWFVIEFSIVMAVAVLISREIVPVFEEIIVTQKWVCLQESHLLNCTQEEEFTPDQGLLNWIFWGIVTAIFLVWYIVIRSFILKKPILQNRS
jgi:hypothetical protein